MNALRLAAGTEFATLAVLLTNLATLHAPSVAAAVGPAHGCAYLFVIVLTARRTRDARTWATAAIPGIGGLFALRRLAAAPVGDAGPDRVRTAENVGPRVLE